jgi:hypothetical protein
LPHRHAERRPGIHAFLCISTARRGWPACAGHDDEGAPSIRPNQPAECCSKPAVGQGGLAPSRVEEANAGVLVSHIGRCRLDDLAVEVEGQSASLPLGFNQVMHRSHVCMLLWSRESCRAGI